MVFIKKQIILSIIKGGGKIAPGWQNSPGLRYYKDYTVLTHKTCIQRAKVRYVKGKMTGSSHDVKQMAKGRPPKIFCQKDKADKLHNVSNENMGAQLKAIGQETDNKLLKVRLSNIIGTSDLLTAVAEDMKYHLLYLSHAKRDIEKAHKTESQRVTKQHIISSQLVSDVEILHMVEPEINDSGISSTLNMTQIEHSYIGMLESNGFALPNSPRYKPYQKQLILGNGSDVHFTRPPD